MRERQQQTVRRNAQYYKPILNQFNIGQWVWIFDPKIIPGSCDKLRSYWGGPYKIVRLMAPALVEVIAVYEQGKPRIVSLDILKEFGGKTMCTDYPTNPHTLHFKGEMRLQKFGARSVLTISVLISVVLYGATATLGALITRITLNWALLKSRKNPRADPIQMEGLILNVGNL